ncbi:MAG TPA: small multi-drug export protein [Dehalococcoidia bacterium]|nr:small multi-drug export protein [Dehalococcoidia bacterium]
MDIVEILIIIGTAASPIIELRGAIPIAIGRYHFTWFYAYLFSVIGNIIPVPFLLGFLEGIIALLSKVHFLDRIIQWFLTKTRQRGKIVERYERFGLALFVAIPLPITGAWTGSILAFLMGLKFKHALVSIIAGVLIAGAIVVSATVLGWAVADIFTKPVD